MPVSKKRSGCRSWGNGCESVGVFKDAFLSGEQCFFRSISLKKEIGPFPGGPTKQNFLVQKRSQQQFFLPSYFVVMMTICRDILARFFRTGKGRKVALLLLCVVACWNVCAAKNHFFKKKYFSKLNGAFQRHFK